MATKMKGFFKGFKNMFSSKEEEREMEIGHPTDVKHLSHIGFDSTSTQAPSWMREFEVASDYTSSSLANLGNVESSSWLNKGILGESEIGHSRSLNTTSTSRDESKASKKIRRKRRAKNPGSPSSSVNSSSSVTNNRNKTGSKFRASCASAIEDTCVGHREQNELFVT